MTTLVLTTILDQPERVQLAGDRWLVSGEFVTDTGDYVTNGIAIAASLLNADTIERLIVGKPSIVRTSAYWIKSTGKIKIFLEDTISGIEAEHAASALTAQSIPFIAVVRKAA